MVVPGTKSYQEIKSKFREDGNYSNTNIFSSPDKDRGFVRVDYHSELDILEIKRMGDRIQGERISLQSYAENSIKVNGHRIRNIKLKKTIDGEVIGILVPNLSKRSPATLNLLEELFEEFFYDSPLKLSVRDLVHRDTKT